MAHSSRHRRILRTVLSTLMLFCITASAAGAQNRDRGPASLHRGIVTLPIIDRQDIRFTRVSVNNTPLEAWTWSITQDLHGFLWFGTIDGLFRHDGYNLKTYRHDAANPNSPVSYTHLTLPTSDLV